jgi:hypothetical protein
VWVTIIDRRESSKCEFRMGIMKPYPDPVPPFSLGPVLLDSEAGVTHLPEIASSRPAPLFSCFLKQQRGYIWIFRDAGSLQISNTKIFFANYGSVGGSKLIPVDRTFPVPRRS